MEKYHVSTLLKNEHGAVFGTTKWLIEANSRLDALEKVAKWMSNCDTLMAMPAIRFTDGVRLPKINAKIADAALIMKDGHPDADNDQGVWSQTRFGRIV